VECRQKARIRNAQDIPEAERRIDVKHIKTPVRHNGMGCLLDADARILVCGQGRIVPHQMLEELAQVVNAHDARVEALLAWQILAEESQAFRLALTNLPHDIGAQILEKTQAALALLEEDTDDPA
jgi:hypothetical protein